MMMLTVLTKSLMKVIILLCPLLNLIDGCKRKCSDYAFHISNGYVSCTDSNYEGSKCYYYCFSSYRRVGTTYLYCKSNGDWDDPKPQCKAICSTDRTSLPNGWVSCTDSNEEGSVCTYNCYSGYIRKGASWAKCLSNTYWDDPRPVCEELCSSDHLSLYNGRASCSNENQQGSRCDYSCNTGYKLSGTSWARCRSNGRWDDPTPSCAIVQCTSSYTSLAYGSVSCSSSYNYGSTCYYSCNTGYRLVGSSSSSCQSNGEWYYSKPSCTIRHCPSSFLQIEHGDSECFNSLYATSYESTCVFRCNAGYELNGEEKATCKGDESWSVAKPACQPKRCGPPYPIRNGNHTCNSTQYEYKSVCKLQCDIGYKLQGNSEIHCKESASWTDKGNCEIIKCPASIISEESTLESCSKGTEYGSRCSYECREGYFLIGSESRVCNSSGEWSSEVPICEERNCTDEYLVLENGNVVCSGSRHRNSMNSFCTYTCFEGFKLTGNATSVCGTDKTWGTAKPICDAITCPSPPKMDLGNFSCDSQHFEYKTICHLTCHTGAELIGNSSITCLANTEWSTHGHCQAKKCPEHYLNIEHGSVFCEGAELNNMFSSHCTYFCNSGYYINGHSHIFCDSTGHWSASKPLCEERQCSSNYTTIEHGEVTCIGMKPNTYNSTCLFRCLGGFELVGATSATCQFDEQWSDPKPYCRRLTCTEPKAPQNGHFICNQTSFEYQDNCSLLCDEGYVSLGSISITCQSNRFWSENGQCIDVQAPKFSNGCAENQTILAAMLGYQTLVDFIMPEVTDNSNQLQSLKAYPESGSAFEEGTTEVHIVAVDNAGNSANCSFYVTVQVLQCSQPDFELTNQQLLKYDCPNKYVYGASCELSCENQIPVFGPNAIQCVKDQLVDTLHWQYAGNVLPKCKAHDCKRHTSPQNGAILCSKTDGNTEFCYVVCKENYLLSRSNSNEYRCNKVSGKWDPNISVPPCRRMKKHEKMEMYPEFYFFAGECHHDREDIQAKFQQCVLNSTFKGSCLAYNGCVIKDVKVECGGTNRRNKRNVQEYYYKITQKIELNNNQESNSSTASREYFTQLSRSMADQLLTAIQSQINNVGLFDRMEYGDVVFLCSPGEEFDEKSFSCLVCGQGSFFNNDTRLCTMCPRNSYQDEETSFSCNRCSNNRKTLQEGSVSLRDCKDFCESGEYSHNGESPCAKCPIGSYQPEIGQTKCHPCPFGMSTLDIGKQSIDSCLFHDILMNNNMSGPIVLTYDNNDIDFTFMTWIFGFSLMPGSNPDQSVVISIDKIQIQLFKTEIREWNILALSYEHGISSLYWNGKLSSTYKNMSLYLYNDDAIKFELGEEIRDLTLYGVQLTTSLLTETDFKVFTNNCQQKVLYNKLMRNPFKKNLVLQYRECVGKCKAGHYSNTGFEPCNKCPVGSYQSKEGMQSCNWCPFSMSTTLDGRTADYHCLFFAMHWSGKFVGPKINITNPFPKEFTFMIRVYANTEQRFMLGEAKDNISDAYVIIDSIALILLPVISQSFKLEAKWNHLALVYKEGLSTLYVNGILSEKRDGLVVSDLHNKRVRFVNPNNLRSIQASEIQMALRLYPVEQIQEFASFCHTEVYDNVLYVDSVQEELVSPFTCDEIPDKVNPLATENNMDHIIKENMLNMATTHQYNSDVAPHITKQAQHITGEAPHLDEVASYIIEVAPQITEEAPYITNEAPKIKEEAQKITEEAPHSTDEALHIAEKEQHISEEEHFTQIAPHITEEALHIAAVASHITEEATDMEPQITNEEQHITEAPHLNDVVLRITGEATDIADMTPHITEEAPHLTEVVLDITQVDPQIKEEATYIAEVAPRITEAALYITGTRPGIFEIQATETEITPSITEFDPPVFGTITNQDSTATDAVYVGPSAANTITSFQILHNRTEMFVSNTEIFPSQTDTISSISEMLSSNAKIFSSHDMVFSRNVEMFSSYIKIEPSNTEIFPSNTEIFSSNYDMFSINNDNLSSNNDMLPSDTDMLPSDTDMLPNDNDMLPSSR